MHSLNVVSVFLLTWFTVFQTVECRMQALGFTWVIWGRIFFHNICCYRISAWKIFIFSGSSSCEFVYQVFNSNSDRGWHFILWLKSSCTCSYVHPRRKKQTITYLSSVVRILSDLLDKIDLEPIWKKIQNLYKQSALNYASKISIDSIVFSTSTLFS